MLYPRSPLFNRLYNQIGRMPVVDCHEHMIGPEACLVERGWFGEDVAVRIAADWLFNNPNRFFGLGFEEV